MNGSAVDLVAGVIERVYQDGTQTELDRRCAREIIEALGEAGWADPTTVRALVASAGGSIDVQQRHLADPPDVLEVMPLHDLDIAYRVSAR